MIVLLFIILRFYRLVVVVVNVAKLFGGKRLEIDKQRACPVFTTAFPLYRVGNEELNNVRLLMRVDSAIF